jgi:hypothetical protein
MIYDMTKWTAIERPGYFGKQRDEIVERYNTSYGKGNWQLGWKYFGNFYSFNTACRYLYERSYFEYLNKHPELLDFITTFDECFDNSLTNVSSGLDYTKQEAGSTHIQDIAIRNCLYLTDTKFNGRSGGKNMLEIRGRDSNGYKLNPGNVPFFVPDQIESPNVAPTWAPAGSVENFWQNNKWLLVSKTHLK